MGIFSKVKKGLSKAWGGIKGAVKTVARTAKKVAKKIAYATPWGKKLWDFSSKVGKGAMKVVGKITSKLGPIGTMALSFVLAPVLGPMIGALWSGFGAGAAAMASSANVFVSALGQVGSGIFAAGNFVGGTLGALGNAVSEGATKVMAGNFSGAATSFASNVSSALTGKAGMAAVHAGAAQAAATASQAAASGESWFAGAEQAAELSAQANASLDKLATYDPRLAGELAAKTGNLPSSPEALKAQVDTAVDPSAYKPTSLQTPDFNVGAPQDLGMNNLNGPTLFERQAQEGLYGKQVSQMTLADQAAYTRFGKEGVIGANTFTPTPTASDKIGEMSSRANQVKSLLGGKAQQDGYQPYVPQAINSTIANASSASGQGSAGFSLLGGVQGLEESLRRSQAMMFG